MRGPVLAALWLGLIPLGAAADPGVPTCLKNARVDPASFSVDVLEFQERDDLRKQIVYDMKASKALASVGCPTLSRAYRDRAEGLKTSLRSFTQNSLEVARTLDTFNAVVSLLPQAAAVMN